MMSVLQAHSRVNTGVTSDTVMVWFHSCQTARVSCMLLHSSSAINGTEPHLVSLETAALILLHFMSKWLLGKRSIGQIFMDCNLQSDTPYSSQLCQGGYVFAAICLSICQQDYRKTTDSLCLILHRTGSVRESCKCHMTPGPARAMTMILISAHSDKLVLLHFIQ